MSIMSMSELRVERIARGVFRSMKCDVSDDEVRRVVRRAMRFIESRKEMRRAA